MKEGEIEMKKGKEIKEMLRTYGVSQEELYFETGYNFNDLKIKENFDEAERLLKWKNGGR